MQLELVNRIQDDRERMRQAIELLDQRLRHLRYEGKKHVAENLRRVAEHVLFLQKDMDKRIRYEEEVLFPFLAMHIPRLEPLFNLLKLDHEQCRHEFDVVAKSSLGGGLEDVLQHGDLLSGLLHSHWSLEEENTIAALQNELKSHEKERLTRLFVAWEAGLCKNDGFRGNYGPSDYRYSFL